MRDQITSALCVNSPSNQGVPIFINIDSICQEAAHHITRGQRSGQSLKTSIGFLHLKFGGWIQPKRRATEVGVPNVLLPDDATVGALEEGANVDKRGSVPNNWHSPNPLKPLEKGMGVRRLRARRE